MWVYLLIFVLVLIIVLVVNYFNQKKLYKMMTYTLEDYITNFFTSYLDGDELKDYLLTRRFNKKEEKNYYFKTFHD